jgi:mannose-6-phosphate isomerase-like protein (cupin superfamily)
MPNSEVAVFNQHAFQERHVHNQGTEIYIVVDGVMQIEVDGYDYHLSSGDMMLINPGTAHEVKPQGGQFLCRVVTLNCGGAKDRSPIPKS